MKRSWMDRAKEEKKAARKARQEAKETARVELCQAFVVGIREIHDDDVEELVGGFEELVGVGQHDFDARVARSIISMASLIRISVNRQNKLDFSENTNRARK